VNPQAYKRYLLSVLLVTLAFNYIDRLALGLLLQDIKVDLDLSDTQLGVLSGIAFALFYSMMGIPIARWADRGNRITILSVTMALWCAAVALCGLAANFVHLLLIRVGVAVGEAGCVPPAHSLIADYFTRAERPRAVAIYKLGTPLSMLVGFFLAGWLNQFYGWRMTFVLLGLPGLALAVLVKMTLREPRLFAPTAAAQSAHTPALRTVFAALWANTTFRHLVFCFSVVQFFGFGIGKWLPSFVIRTYGLQTGWLGTWFALIIGLGGLVGTWWGGELASRHATHNERLQLQVMAAAYPVIGLIWAGVFLAPNPYVAFALMGLATMTAALALGPLFATIQTLVPERMRAMSIAIVFLFANFIGLGLGPLAVGALSDAFRPWASEESLRHALLAMCPGYLWGAWHFWRASRTVAADLDQPPLSR
jgi:predicted MFS family arabinose efflux permease